MRKIVFFILVLSILGVIPHFSINCGQDLKAIEEIQLEGKLDKILSGQEEILRQLAQIREELQTLKIWTRRK